MEARAARPQTANPGLDGITWHVVESFDDIVGRSQYPTTIWSAVGPLGYVILGPLNSDGWYSPDLVTWYEISTRGGSDYLWRGWFGPSNVTISDKMIVIGSDDVTGTWIGTPSN